MLSAGEARADGAPSWEVVPPMISPRGRHTATLLHDGRVLVAGGYATSAVDGAPFVREVEIYDPASKAWTPAAPLSAALHGLEAAVLLASGDVFVTDGTVAEVYTPTLDRWTALPPLPTTGPWRSGPSAVLLPGGKVLVVWVGGSWADGYNLGGSVYDPASSSWTAIPPRADLDVGADATAALLDDGRVLVLTGKNGEIYDPASDAWVASSELEHRQFDHRAVRLTSGDVLVVGAGAGEPVSPYVVTASEVYLRESDLWMTIENTSIEWESGDGVFTAACWGGGVTGIGVSLLPSGRVLRTGGMRHYFCDMRPGSWNPDLPLTVGYEWMLFDLPIGVYDPASFFWSPLDATPPVTMARAHHTSTRLDDGSVLIAGGYIDDDAFDGDPEEAIMPAAASAVLFHELPPRGAPCAAGSDCASGFCADAVCCDAACDGPSHACAVAEGASRDGVCTPLSGTGGSGGSGGEAGGGGATGGGGEAGGGGDGGSASGEGGVGATGGSGGEAGGGGGDGGSVSSSGGGGATGGSGGEAGGGGGDGGSASGEGGVGATGGSGGEAGGGGGDGGSVSGEGGGGGVDGAQSGAGGGSSGGGGCHMTPGSGSAPPWLLLLGGLVSLRLRRRSTTLPSARRSEGGISVR
ncbi:kelch repeat-containing protein [Sorangium sp. So ce513]|uniref:Kelch repeat-containing protein n=1 Tax=Sorangium sp. So ce513 TaxID=3133315 RepID=UPI003F61A7E9